MLYNEQLYELLMDYDLREIVKKRLNSLGYLLKFLSLFILQNLCVKFHIYNSHCHTYDTWKLWVMNSILWTKKYQKRPNFFAYNCYNKIPEYFKYIPLNKYEYCIKSFLITNRHIWGVFKLWRIYLSRKVVLTIFFGIMTIKAYFLRLLFNIFFVRAS